MILSFFTGRYGNWFRRKMFLNQNPVPGTMEQNDETSRIITSEVHAAPDWIYLCQRFPKHPSICHFITVKSVCWNRSHEKKQSKAIRSGKLLVKERREKKDWSGENFFFAVLAQPSSYFTNQSSYIFLINLIFIFDFASSRLRLTYGFEQKFLLHHWKEQAAGCSSYSTWS